MKLAHLIRGEETIARARSLAEEWLTRDPRLKSEASSGARFALSRMLEQGFSLAGVG